LFAVQDIERQLRQKLADEFDESLARLDVLAALSRVRGGVTMTELSGLLRLTKGNITGLVGRLVRDGLVTRQARDGRSVVVDLSPKGRALFARMAAAHEAWLDELLGSLSPGDLRALVGVLAKLRASL
jgi:DNA-binding MarR family transcriptional regulator